MNFQVMGCRRFCGRVSLSVGVAPSIGNFERWMKGALGMGHLSLRRLTAEDLEGGFLYWVP